ncbi:putative enoyl-CoA hydratase echA8 [Variovorax sp. PBL-H6]|uniref:enoyl-CoA hydratase-related protein n=1 Tax=Variovorax sp. PBL-H6 TaxID=434009 RepID=UPI001317E857|nr:enoyl-CoA hydratase-related protein [Variovorax sp. PBL-H6]VTU18014.1 putative enoyl-CoA hydratase echA8 [Variovorax sp. PBL-H6]
MQLLQDLLYEKRAGIAYITINRPQAMNALSHKVLDELRSVMEDARADPTVHGVIVTGAGDKAFVTGAEVTGNAWDSSMGAEELMHSRRSAFDLIEQLGKPVIAAVNGCVSGEGCELAMACSLRLATAHARFGRPEALPGFVRGFGGMQRLLRLVGRGRALQLILTADTIDATEAQRNGLVDEIVDADQLIARAETILGRMEPNAPVSAPPAGMLRSLAI